MPLDPSIFQNAGPKPIDIGSLIEMARGKQRLDAESSLGGIIGQATNPDGSIDAGKLGRLAPQAGVMAPEMAARAQQFQAQQNTIDAGKLENMRSFLQAQDRLIYPLVNKPDLDHHDVLDAVHSLVGTPTSMLKGGMFSSTHAIDATRWLYGPDGQPRKGPEIAKYLRLHHAQVINALEQSEPIKQGVDSNGREVWGTRSGWIVQGAPDVNRGPSAGGAPPGGSAAPPSGRTAQTSTVPFTMPTGFEESAKGSGLLLARDLDSAANYRREVFPLEQAIPALARLGKTGTGPGTDELNKIKSFLQSAGAGDLLGIDVGKIEKFDEAKKYLTDWVMANGSTGTNDKLAAAFASNANVGISNAAAINVAKSALAVRRMRHAQAVEFAQSGLPEGQYSRWAATWNAKQDPRAFGFDLMTRDAATKFLKSLSPAERKRFDESRDIAERNGLHSPRGGWNAE